jgi:hypothetical protein
MIGVHFIALAPSLILAALTPAKVSDVETKTSAMPALRRPSVIYVKSFFIRTTASKSEDSRRRRTASLARTLRGGEENTVIGRHREEQHEDTLANLPGLLQKALLEDLSKSVAPTTSGDSSHSSRDCWIIAGEFVAVDTGSRALQAGVGFGAGQSQLEVRARVYAGSGTNTPFLTFDSEGASGHLPGAVVAKNPYLAAAKFVMSKREPEREAKKVAKSITDEIGKFMVTQGIPTLKSTGATGVASGANR